MEIKLDLVCEYCRNDLEAIQYNTTVVVRPCQYCLDKTYDTAYKDGTSHENEQNK